MTHLTVHVTTRYCVKKVSRTSAFLSWMKKYFCLFITKGFIQNWIHDHQPESSCHQIQLIHQLFLVTYFANWSFCRCWWQLAALDSLLVQIWSDCNECYEDKKSHKIRRGHKDDFVRHRFYHPGISEVFPTDKRASPFT